MAELGIGRTPIREAVRMLEQAKLVEVYPRRGVFVTSVNISDLAVLSEVREAWKRTPRGSPRSVPDEERQELAALIEESRRKDKLDRRALIDLDRRIHGCIYRCTHNEFLEATLDEYYVLALRIWFLALDRVERLDEAVSEHGELSKRSATGDGTRAEKRDAPPRPGLRASGAQGPVVLAGLGHLDLVVRDLERSLGSTRPSSARSACNHR